MSLFKCPVCQKELIKKDHCYQCENKHNYDLAAKGYVNLLLANQKHSVDPGDCKEMIEARVLFLKLNYYGFLRQCILENILKYAPSETFNFCDLACGEGYYTNYLHQEVNKIKNMNTIGIDISKYAILEACKKKREMNLDQIEFCIGNLMNLPFLNDSFSIMLNCFALFDEKEFYRVLKDQGFYIRVLPDAYHLYDLKKKLYKNVILNVMKEKTINGFHLIDEIHIEKDITLKTKDEIYNLFTMTPYYYKTSQEDKKKLLEMDCLTTKAAFVLLIYQKGENEYENATR